MDMKYLGDGRKVAVIGQINSTESIVQEIYVTPEGDEVPKGERFTTKTLLDAPLKTYKEKEITRLEERKKEIELSFIRSEKALRDIKLKLKGYEEVFRQVTALAQNMRPSDFDVLVGVMSGSIEYCVVESYGVPEILQYPDALMKYEGHYGELRFDMVKLLSLMGQSDGSLTYRIHQYSDGSGGSGSQVSFFRTLKQAIEFCREHALKRLRENKLSLKEVSKYEKIGVVFTKEELAPLIQKERASVDERRINLLKRQSKELLEFDAEVEQILDI